MDRRIFGISVSQNVWKSCFMKKNRHFSIKFRMNILIMKLILALNVSLDSWGFGMEGRNITPNVLKIKAKFSVTMAVAEFQLAE